jgi:amino acid adenylation domain-containing protein
VNEIIGDFTSLTLLAVDSLEGDCFETRAQRLQRRLFDDLDQRYVSGVRVIREMARLQGNAARPMMPVVFTSGLTMGDEADSADRAAPFELGNVVYSISQTPQVLIDHQVGQQGGALVFNWDVVEEAFPPGLLDDMFGAYCRLLRQLADDESTWRSATLDLLPPTQWEQRARVNGTATEQVNCLLDAPFASQAQRQPDHPAVVSRERTLTFRELDQESNQLAHHLRRLGIGSDQLVAVVLEKGWEQVVAVLAIVRAGAAYLPIDPSLPRERQHLLLERGDAKVAITRSDMERPAGLRVICLDDTEWRREDATSLEGARNPSDLAYVIFTSGSTGFPKGVMIEHGAAWNTVVDINKRFRVGPSDRVLALSALSFDLSVYDIFGILAAGGTVVLPDPARLRDPEHWSTLLSAEKITIWNSVPALMQMQADFLQGLSREFPETLRLVMLSGDWLPVTLPDHLRQLNPGNNAFEVVSLGGATEASIWSILYPIPEVSSSWASIPYGKPMANQTFHVFNRRLEPCPTWVSGELYIGGAGVARGYWKDKEKTDASFLVHPRSGERIYRTGDLGRYLPDGNIEFLGREDFQVKIQGFRIELGEIEATLGQHPAVKTAVVTAVGEPRGNKHLVAYVVLENTLETTDGLRAFLRSRLPEYMVPAMFVLLQNLPLTANGKVDRAALPQPTEDRRTSDNRSVPPRDHLELQLARIWSEVLGIPNIGLRDNFFELGGHSLTAVRLATRLQNGLSYRIPLAAFFRHPTIEDLARLLRDQGDRTPEAALVSIQTRGSKRPLFWVHPAGGNVFSYIHLAQALGPEQPFFAFQSKGLTLSQNLGPDNIQDIAAEYCAELVRLPVEQPYQLGGWSMGGAVAFEMARQLCIAGCEVSHLFVVDAAAPGFDADMSAGNEIPAGIAFARELGIPLHKYAADVKALANLGPERQVERIFEWAQEGGLLPSEESQETVARLFKVFRRNLAALDCYSGAPYAGRMTLFRSTDYPGASHHPLLGWDKFVQGGIDLQVMQGDHYSILSAPLVRHLADRLIASLRPKNELTEPSSSHAVGVSGKL